MAATLRMYLIVVYRPLPAAPLVVRWMRDAKTDACGRSFAVLSKHTSTVDLRLRHKISAWCPGRCPPRQTRIPGARKSGNYMTTRKFGETQGNHQEIALIQQETWSTFVCDAPVSHKRRKKSPIFFLLIFSGNPRAKSRFFIYLR
jgi:hypothetical protein